MPEKQKTKFMDTIKYHSSEISVKSIPEINSA